MIFFGDKTIAWLDLWSLEHFFAGCNSAVALSYILSKYFPDFSRQKNLNIQIILLLCLEFYWEMIEHYLESGASFDAITNWFQGVEYIGNRLVGDPIVTLLGLFFITKFPKTRAFSVVFSMAWLFVNIFVMSDSMELNRLLF